MNNKNSESNKTSLERRELLKSLATIPVVGAFLVALWQKMRLDALKKSNLLADLIQEKSAPTVISGLSDSRHLNLGIIGYGGRGSHLIRGAGFATKYWTNAVSENARKKTYNTENIYNFMITFYSFILINRIRNKVKMKVAVTKMSK